MARVPFVMLWTSTRNIDLHDLPAAMIHGLFVCQCEAEPGASHRMTVSVVALNKKLYESSSELFS